MKKPALVLTILELKAWRRWHRATSLLTILAWKEEFGMFPVVRGGRGQ